MATGSAKKSVNIYQTSHKYELNSISISFGKKKKLVVYKVLFALLNCVSYVSIVYVIETVSLLSEVCVFTLLLACNHISCPLLHIMPTENVLLISVHFGIYYLTNSRS